MLLYELIESSDDPSRIMLIRPQELKVAGETMSAEQVVHVGAGLVEILLCAKVLATSEIIHLNIARVKKKKMNRMSLSERV